MAGGRRIHDPNVFDPETVHIIIQAYDDAWKSLRGSIFAAQHRAEETRQILARRVIEIAQRGERDPIYLRDGALDCFVGLAA
jgi:hypothetical protein